MAVEIDGRLIPVLKETLGGYSNVAVVNEDVLKTDMARLIEENFGGMRVCFCANLPITLRRRF